MATRPQARVISLTVAQGIFFRTASCDNPNGDTALHWAIRRGATQLVRQLVRHDALVGMSNDEGQTPLHVAAELGKVRTCRVLLDAYVSWSTVKDKNGDTALDIAVRKAQEQGETQLLHLLRNRFRIDELEAQVELYCRILAFPDKVFEEFRYIDPLLLVPVLLCLCARETSSLALFRRLFEIKGADEVDVNAPGSHNITALHLAAQHSSPSIIQYLIDKGASVDALDNKLGSTPLGIAISAGKADNVKVLLEAGANASFKIASGRPLLHIAAQGGKEDIMCLLLDRGADANVLDENGEASGYWAAGHGHLGSLKLLLERGLDANKGGYGPMRFALQNGHKAIVQTLVEHGVQLGADGRQHVRRTKDNKLEYLDILLYVLKNTKDEDKKVLLQDVKDASERRWSEIESILELGNYEKAAAFLEHNLGSLEFLATTSRSFLLCICAEHHLLNGVRRLLSSGPITGALRRYGVKPLQWTALHVAVYKAAVFDKDLELVRLLIEHGWDPAFEDERGCTALDIACMYGHEKLVKELLFQSPVNHRDRDRCTTFHYAAFGNSIAVLDLLYSVSKDIDKLNVSWDSPLQLACEKGMAAAVNWFVGKGCKIDRANRWGYTPLHYGAKGDHEEITTALVELGADVNAMSSDGSTPLHLAARIGSAKAVLLLLDHSADANITDSEGKTALVAALSAGKLPSEPLAALFERTSIDWNVKLSSNVIFAAFKGRQNETITKVLSLLKARFSDKPKPTVRHLAPELVADILVSPDPPIQAFPQLLEYLHPSSRKLLAAHMLLAAIKSEGTDDAGVVQSLLVVDPDIAAQRFPGMWTTLHLACRHGKIQIARVILANGGMVKEDNKTEKTLMELVEEFHPDKAKAFQNLFRHWEIIIQAVMQRKGIDSEILKTALTESEEGDDS